MNAKWQQSLGRIVRQARKSFIERDIELLELASAMLMGLWGLWHVIPWFETFKVSPGAWELLEMFASEPAWGGLAGLLSLTRIKAVLEDDPAHRQRTAQWACSIWFATLVSFAWHNVGMATVSLYLGFTAIDVWIFWRLTSMNCPKSSSSG